MKPQHVIAWLLAGVAGLWAFTAHQRQVGALTLQLQQNRQHIAALDASLAVARSQFRTDTVTLFRRLTRTETRLDSILRTDTLRMTDTVRVPVTVLAEADSSIKACRETVRSCAALRALEEARGDSLAARVRLLERAKPGLWSRCGLTVGYGSTDKGLGPAVVAGCRVWP